MESHSKAEQLQIRASAFQKAKLAEAARAMNMNVSQFVLSSSLQAAENVLVERTRIVMGEAAFRQFNQLLDEPPTVLAGLKQQFDKMNPQ